MRIPTPLYALGAAAAIAALAGCSGGASAVNPMQASQTNQSRQRVSPMSMSHVPSLMAPAKLALIRPSSVQPKGWMSKDATSGLSLLYASQFFTSDIQSTVKPGPARAPLARSSMV